MSSQARPAADRVQAYLRGELSETETAEFEAAYLDDPVLLDQLETDWVIRQGLEDGAAVSRQEPDRRWAIAASVAIVASAALVALAVSQSSRIDALRDRVAELSAPTARTTIARVSAMRASGDPGVDVRIGAEMDSVVLVFEMSLPDQPAYDLRLFRVGVEAAVLEYANVPVQGAGDLIVLVPTALVGADDYRAEVSADGSVVAEFSLRVQSVE